MNLAAPAPTSWHKARPLKIFLSESEVLQIVQPFVSATAHKFSANGHSTASVKMSQSLDKARALLAYHLNLVTGDPVTAENLGEVTLTAFHAMGYFTLKCRSSDGFNYNIKLLSAVKAAALRTPLRPSPV